MNKIIIPLKPLSVNAVWQGRRFKTPAYLKYEKDCKWFMEGDKINGEVEIKIKFYINNYSCSDIDNFAKPILDIMVKSGLIEDDRMVKRLVLEKYKNKKESMEILISKYN